MKGYASYKRMINGLAKAISFRQSFRLEKNLFCRMEQNVNFSVKRNKTPQEGTYYDLCDV